MSDTDRNSTVLVISEDSSLLSSLYKSNSTNFQFISRESIQSALDESNLLNNNHIVVIDIDSSKGGTAEIIDQTLKLKKSDPTQIIMMVGDPEPLREILQSSIQPIIYRAFNKPVSPNQVFLAFGSASKEHENLIAKKAAGEDLFVIGPAENRTSIESIAAQKKNKSALYASIGVIALGLVTWLLLDDRSDTENLTSAPLITPTFDQVESTSVTNNDVSDINKFNQEAAKALLEGRQVSPPDDNALHYYNQVLAIDPYDLTAYEGKKNLVVDLKNSYAAMVENAEYERALQTIDILQKIEPLDTSNYQLRAELELTIKQHAESLANTGSASEIKQTAAVLAEIDSQSKTSQLATEALNNEKLLLDKIDQALKNNNLIPPDTDNAFSIVSEALQKNTISEVNFEPRIAILSEKLLASANSAFDKENLEETEKLAALVKRLNVNAENLAVLENKIQERKTALVVEQQGNSNSAEENEKTEPQQVKIIPAKIISRSSPRYPSRALDRNIEGWVSIGFTIDTDGMPVDIKVIESEPSGTFDDATIAAVKEWRFSPAMIEGTQQAIVSTVDATKLHFQIDQ